MFFALILIFSLIPLLLFIGLIVLVIRLLLGHKGKNAKPIGLREILLTCLIIAAGYAGLVGLFMLPYAFVGTDSGTYKEESYGILAAHLVAAIGLLISGMIVGRLTGRFVMSLGIILLIGSTFPAFETLGSSGGFIAVLLAFIALIVITVKVSKKAENHG